MDFKPMKKDRKADETGHWPWESPRLRAAVDEARKGRAPKTAEGLTPVTWIGVALNAGMIAKDAPKVTAEEPRAESVVSTLWMPAQLEGHGPWVEWTGEEKKPYGQGEVLFGHERKEQICTLRKEPLHAWKYLRKDQSIDPYGTYILVAYCRKETL